MLHHNILINQLEAAIENINKFPLFLEPFMSLLLVLSNMDFKLNLEVRTFLYLVQFSPDIILGKFTNPM